MDAEACQDLLAALDAATSLKDLSPLKSLGLHKLTGDRKGQWAMNVNGPWRIYFSTLAMKSCTNIQRSLSQWTNTE